MTPKKKKTLIVCGTAAAVLILALTAFIIVSAQKDNGATVKLLVYYYNPTSCRLEPEEHAFPSADDGVLLNTAIAQLRETPKTPVLVKTMPETENFFTGYQLDNTELILEFSPAYYEMPPLEEAIFRASLIWTVSELPFVEQVRITVGGEELTNSRGDILGAENKLTVSINPVISPERIMTRTFTLYFVNANADRLVPEERTVENVNSDQIDKFIVQQLIDGPQLEGNISVIPIETKIREVKTEDNICYVNLSSDFNSKFNGSPALARLMVYSIVNTLTENLKVKRVQFFIESEVLDQFQGITDFNRTFEKDETFLNGQEE